MTTKPDTNWDEVPWTPFELGTMPEHPFNEIDRPEAVLINSRYQVTVYLDRHETLGRIAHLSFKTHDRQARHDWRDMQRIKNEICGKEYEAVEIYPAESRLVDTANQYHLYVFLDTKIPFGMTGRLVSEGEWNNSRQRPWPEGERPADAIDSEQYDQLLKTTLEKIRSQE